MSCIREKSVRPLPKGSVSWKLPIRRRKKRNKEMNPATISGIKGASGNLREVFKIFQWPPPLSRQLKRMRHNRWLWSNTSSTWNTNSPYLNFQMADFVKLQASRIFNPYPNPPHPLTSDANNSRLINPSSTLKSLKNHLLVRCLHIYTLFFSRSADGCLSEMCKWSISAKVVYSG